MNWPTAQCEQGTVCISCHTALPYAPLRRVQPWPQLPPIYRNKAVASRSTETVLNALIATDENARHGQISAATVTAVDNMWVLRQTSGADAGSWPWIQFDNEPWEA